MLLAPLTSSAGDLVNERLSASTAAREAHWGVDCNAALEALHGAAGSSAEMDETLTKCRFIHQPPGVDGADNCPDYQAIFAAYKGHDPEALKRALQNSKLCLEAESVDDQHHN